MHGVPQGVSISILITTVMPEEATTTRTVENYQDACRNGIEKNGNDYVCWLCSWSKIICITKALGNTRSSIVRILTVGGTS